MSSLLLLSLLLVGPATAQQTVCEGQEGEAAISCVQANYSPSGTLGYDTARDTMFANIDSEGSGELEGIYSGFTITLTPGEDPTEDAFSKGINTEHVFPQSKGAGSEPRKSDMHNLRPTREEVNFARSNIPFGESPDAQTDAWYFEDSTRSAPPASNIDAWSERLSQSDFEPREAREGDIARAALYFYAVYRPSADDAFFDGMREQLLQWHEADPATQAELTRSESVAQRQGNENPFVLDETLAARAFDTTGDSGLALNEVLADPATGEDGDANQDGTRDASEDEFFEIYNNGSSSVDLAGYELIDDGVGVRHVFPEGTTLEAEEGIVVFGGGSPAASIPGTVQTASSGGLGLNNGGDSFTLTGVTGDTILTHSYDGSIDDESMARDPDFTGDFVAHSSATGTGGALFSPGRTLSGDPLPVEMAGFEATVTEGGVRLKWQTASETGNAGFEVQRRAGEKNGGGTWKQVGQVEGSGTTTGAKSYRFTDTDPPYGADRLEYRLKQVDTDGSASYTDPVSVERTVGEIELLSTYPNPARSQATVRYALPSRQELSLKIYDMLGRQVRTVAEGKREGRQERQVDVSGLPSGAYFLRLQADGQTRTQRLTVVR